MKEGNGMIYLDHAATTPVHPEVAEAMRPLLLEKYGNPSSLHRYGREARAAVDEARETIAESLGAEPGEIVFTSGGTEADNLALVGVAWAARERGKGNHIVTSTIEHPAVLETCAFLEKIGFRITYVPVNRYGELDIDALAAALTDDTVLVSVMMGNNEVGTRQPIETIGALVKERGAWFHTDAVQAMTLEAIDCRSLPVDLLSISAHKINGPKGVGALYVAKGVPLEPLLHGGMQERRRRGGTENVPGIVGFQAAVKLLRRTLPQREEKYRQLRETMLRELTRRLGTERFVVNGHPERGYPHILNISFPGVDSETLLIRLDMAGVAASSGSACTAGAMRPSHVLRAMGLDETLVRSAVRFSFGYETTEDEVVTAARIVADAVEAC
ncbi:MAG: cysteine desulfurase NifS [Bacillaceae bacterium G1]|nr:cysteine desulfurase NifS [Bacillota bacterium]OJF17885.1 MAG: cysteine desulfurase NifS [Bacillaceae bacterium G1]